MEKFGWRGFFELFLGGALLLSVVFLGVRLYLSETSYRTYREGIYTRAYESSISFLGTYITEKDPALAPLVVARLSELPLSASESESVRRLVTDMTEGAYDTAAAERSLAYSKALLCHLSYHRSEIYRGRWQRGSLALPAYPEADLPTAFLPSGEEEEDSLPEKLAKELLGASALSYHREDRLCFRSASGFAEFLEGRPVRLLIYRAVGDAEAEPATVEAAARSLLAAYGYGSTSLSLVTSYREGGFVTLRFSSEQEDITLSLTKDDARLHSLLVERRP